MTRDEAEAAAARVLADVGWAKSSIILRDRTIERAVGWAIFFGSPDGSTGYGAGPIVVARTGRIYLTGSAFPPEAFLEDVCVMSGATMNPLRIARYLWRRLTDGRTPTRYTTRAKLGL